MIITAMNQQEFGRGWAIAMGVVFGIVVLGWLLDQWTKPRRRGRRF